MYKRAVSAVILTALLAGCSIQQKVEPVNLSQDSQLCIIENTKVRDGFLQEFRSVLAARQIPHQMVEQFDVPENCQWTATYNAKWSWDMATYMSLAEIKVYHKGELMGEALYDATKGGANMNKFISADEKIRELVNELFQSKLASLFFGSFA